MCCVGTLPTGLQPRLAELLNISLNLTSSYCESMNGRLSARYWESTELFLPPGLTFQPLSFLVWEGGLKETLLSLHHSQEEESVCLLTMVLFS